VGGLYQISPLMASHHLGWRSASLSELIPIVKGNGFKYTQRLKNFNT
jgi:hypothetical protein